MFFSISWHLPDFVAGKVENNIYTLSCFFLTDFVLFGHYISSGNITFSLFMYVTKLYLLKSQYSKEKT